VAAVNGFWYLLSLIKRLYIFGLGMQEPADSKVGREILDAIGCYRVPPPKK